MHLFNDAVLRNNSTEKFDTTSDENLLQVVFENLAQKSARKQI